MESFEPNTSGKEPTPEEIKQLLSDSLTWALKIVKEQPLTGCPDMGSTPATTQQAEDAEKFGLLSVVNDGNMISVELVETSYMNSADNSTEQYILKFAYGVGEYELTVLEQRKLRKATPAEVQRLANILEIGAFGDAYFDFELFDEQYAEHLQELEAIKRVAEENGTNENHPE